jgi:hypothetical protein
MGWLWQAVLFIASVGLGFAAMNGKLRADGRVVAFALWVVIVVGLALYGLVGESDRRYGMAAGAILFGLFGMLCGLVDGAWRATREWAARHIEAAAKASDRVENPPEMTAAQRKAVIIGGALAIGVVVVVIIASRADDGEPAGGEPAALPSGAIAVEPAAEQSCPCDGSRLCTGPKGGVYCIAADGKKRYKQRGG